MRQPAAHDGLPEALATSLPDAFEQVVEIYQHRLFGFALRLAADAHDAEEIVQDALLRAYRALCSYPPERIRAIALRPWLYQITLNVARNRQRGRRLPVQSLQHEQLAGYEPPAGETTDPVALLLATERQATLARCLLALPLRQRAAVILRHVEGLSYAEVATALDTPIGTVKANVHRGVRLLRAALVDAGTERPASASRPNLDAHPTHDQSQHGHLVVTR